MYKINITKIAHYSINNFITYFKNKFIETFSNTGLYYEKEIKDEYIKKSNIFKENIYNSLYELFQEDKILGIKKIENGNFETTIIVGNYRLFIEYWEDDNEKIRFIENIRFFYK